MAVQIPAWLALVAAQAAMAGVDIITDVVADSAVDTIYSKLNDFQFGGNPLMQNLVNQVKFRASSMGTARMMQHSMNFSNKLQSNLENYAENVKTIAKNHKVGFTKTLGSLGKAQQRKAKAADGKIKNSNDMTRNYLQGSDTALNRVGTFTQGNRAMKNTYDFTNKAISDNMKLSDPNLIKLLNALGYLPAKGSTV